MPPTLPRCKRLMQVRKTAAMSHSRMRLGICCSQHPKSACNRFWNANSDHSKGSHHREKEYSKLIHCAVLWALQPSPNSRSSAVTACLLLLHITNDKSRTKRVVVRAVASSSKDIHPDGQCEENLAERPSALHCATSHNTYTQWHQRLG